MKKAILAVSYGTANTDAREKSIDMLESDLRQAFPDYDICRAFTGKRIRELMRKQGIPVDSVNEALVRLEQEEYEKVVIQPSHIIGGSEYDSIRNAAKLFKGHFSELIIGKPLLSDPSDIKAVSHFFHRTFDTNSHELVIMGHGSEHSANQLYSDFADTCQELGYTHIHIATLESSPGIDDLIPALRGSGRKDIILTPLLFVAGDHACRDMAGDGPHSWKSRLTAEDFRVTTVVKGLGEYSEIRAIYTSHLKSVLNV